MGKRVKNRRGKKRTKKHLKRLVHAKRKAQHERRSYGELKKLATMIVEQNKPPPKQPVDFFGGAK